MKSPCCAHCGQSLASGDFGRELYSLRLTAHQWEILKPLIRARGEPVAYERLTARLYSGKDRRNPKNALQVAVHTMNKEILSAGYWIVAKPEFGFRLVRTPYKPAAEAWSPRNILRA